MSVITKVRIDKYLWAIRCFKSRTLATEACDGGKVKINGDNVKPSSAVKINDTIHARAYGNLKIYKVTALLEKRVGAALVANYCIDESPEPEPDAFYNAPGAKFGVRKKGEGRPTKLDRRDITTFLDVDDKE